MKFLILKELMPQLQIETFFGLLFFIVKFNQVWITNELINIPRHGYLRVNLPALCPVWERPSPFCRTWPSGYAAGSGRALSYDLAYKPLIYVIFPALKMIQNVLPLSSFSPRTQPISSSRLLSSILFYALSVRNPTQRNSGRLCKATDPVSFPIDI